MQYKSKKVKAEKNTEYNDYSKESGKNEKNRQDTKLKCKIQR